MRSETHADYIAGFPDHPHRGFETVTYMVAGSMEHRDHQGNQGLVESGGAQLITAGRGLVHSEMPHQEHGLMWGFQLWINLQASDKLCEPQYVDIPRDAIPEVVLPEMSGRVRVIAGSLRGVKGAVFARSVPSLLYFDVALAPYSVEEFVIPAGYNACVYVFEGSARFGDLDDQSKKALGRHDLGVLADGDALRVRAASLGVRFLILAAKPLAEPIARYGPFVMNTREQVLQAVSDFRHGRFLEDPLAPSRPNETPEVQVTP
jgi:redox-sensitive bicupin YhaK (pirin superfamily)